MGTVRETKVGTREAPSEILENLGGGPLATTSGNAPRYGGGVRRVTVRSRLERAGFWVVVAAAVVVLLVLLGFILPPLVGGMVSAFYAGAFVGLLTLMNLQRPSVYANTLLGRRVFPVIQASGPDIWRLASVNAGLTAVYAFFFSVVASFIGPFFAGLLVFGGVAAAGVFYNRVRKVIIRP